MNGIGRVKRNVAGLRNRLRARLALAVETRVRLVAAALWLLVATAAIGGVVGLVRPAPVPPGERTSARSPSATVSEAWAAGGFGVRAVAAYLVADDTGGEAAMAGFLGEGSSSTVPDREAADAPPVAVVAVDPAGAGYWAVTVAAGEAGGEEFWRVGVAIRRGRLVATGLPTPVTAPPIGEPPELVVTSWVTPPTDDPAVEAVTGWAAAYVCGQGDVSRWTAPGVRLDAVSPALCSEVRLDRWATRPDGEDRLLAVSEAVLDPGASERRVSFAVVLGRRDGRWEVAELLPAPPLSDEEVEG